MWHEARRQERKIRGMLVDYRRRAERRRDFYEKIKADPTQFLQLHGRPCKIHLDSAIATAADSPATMMPWQGQADNLIDRFDVRAHLDFIPPINPDPEEESYEERQCNYERYRILSQNVFLGVNEEKFLKQMHLEEQFGYTADKEKEKKGKTGVAIGFNYDEPGKESLMKTEKNSSDSDDSDSDLDVDLCIDVSKIEQSQAHEMNRCGQQFGMCSNDFYSFLINDMEEAENLRIAREEEHEKALYSGRKSRRERRAHRERRLANRIPSPPSYAARASPTYPAFRESKSNSKSPSPENTGQITYITSFGDEDDVGPSTSKTTYADKVKYGKKLEKPKPRRKRSRSKSHSPKPRYRSKSKSRSPKRYHARSKSRSPAYRKSASPPNKKYRNRSRSRSPKQYRSKSSSPKRRYRMRKNSSASPSKSRSPKRYCKSRSQSPKSRSTKHRNDMARSKSKSRSPQYRNRSRDSPKRSSKSESISPYFKDRRNIKGSSWNRGKYRSRSRSKRNVRSRSVSKSSSSSCSTDSSKSRSRSRSIGDSGKESPRRIESPKPVQRYYGRRQEDKSSSELSESDEDSSKPAADCPNLNEKATVFGNSGSTSKVISGPKLTPQERLKRKMQILLNKQYKADKIAEQMRTERAQQEQRNREDELREMALKLRRKQRERRHAYDDNSHSSDSDSSDNSSKESEEHKRSVSPPSPRRRRPDKDEEIYKEEPKPRRERERERSPKRQRIEEKPRNEDRHRSYRNEDNPSEYNRKRNSERYDSRRDDNRKYRSLVDY